MRLRAMKKQTQTNPISNPATAFLLITQEMAKATYEELKVKYYNLCCHKNFLRGILVTILSECSTILCNDLFYFFKSTILFLKTRRVRNKSIFLGI